LQQTKGAIVETTETPVDDLQILADVLSSLKKLDPESQRRLLFSVATFLGLDLGSKSIPQAIHTVSIASGGSASPQASFSQDRSISPKDFLNDKLPQTDVEKVACLAYYLTHFRSMPYFETVDISKLNTEAAQIKFSNTTYAINNAVQSGYLAPAPQGKKQLSAAGERFVQALPDREAARIVIANARRRRQTKKAIRADSAG
jgi:hypothetical protein